MPNPIIATPKQAVVYPDFGKWLTYSEAIKSPTAIRLGIDNTPTSAIYAKMVQVYQRFYAPACEYYKLKLPVTSFYRCDKLNKAVGGAATSAHTFGCAIDIDCDSLAGSAPHNIDLFSYFRQHYLFDQLIKESPDQHDNPQWIHVAVNRYGQTDRQEVLVMHRKNGVSSYENI